LHARSSTSLREFRRGRPVPVLQPKQEHELTITRTIAKLALAGAVAALTACASMPSPEQMRAETASYQLPKLPENGKAIVYVVRPSGVGGLIRFNVFVDDQEAASEMGFTRGSQYIYFNLTPGEHKILSKAENWAETMVTAKAGDIIFIQQDASMGIIMARNSIFKVEDYQGKYHVKTLTLGTIAKSDK
jgi:hypothetical protein